MLRSSDCSEEASGRIALSLGLRERGGKVKTGSNQGVVLEIPWVREMVRALRSAASDGDEPLFPLTQQQFRR
eukprot:14044288-Heterocapsa_arctica.AAC.1